MENESIAKATRRVHAQALAYETYQENHTAIVNAYVAGRRTFDDALILHESNRRAYRRAVAAAAETC